MIRRYIESVALVFGLLMCSGRLQAQVLPSLFMNQDPVSLAMGSSGVAADADAFALENNVAAIPFAEQSMAVKAGFGLWQPSYADLKTIGLAGMYKVSEKIGLALDFKYLMLPSYSGVTGGGADIRDSEFTPKEFGLSAGFSYAFIDCLSAGLSLRYAGSSLASDANAKVFGADLGVFFKKNALSAGLSLNNIGTKVKYSQTAYSQPMLVKMGAGYNLEMGSSELFFSAQADVLFAGGVMAGAGCEYSFKDMVFARAGYHYGNAVNAVPSHGSAGVGIKVVGVSLDVAYLYGSKTLANSLCLSLGYSF